jgi:PAS domain S-box-containing protein
MRNKVKILNCDDTPSMRYGRSRILREAGYIVIEAERGEDALRLVREEMPHLVLMDVNLPDMSGIDVCRHIKSDPVTGGIPVVQISATFVTEDDQDKGLGGGADIYVAEPVEPLELKTIVNVLLKLRRTEAGLKETEARWRRFVDANVIGVMVLEDDRIVEANDVFLTMIGYSREELLARRLTWQDLTPPEHRTVSARAYASFRDTGAIAPFEKEYITRDGGRINVVIGAAALDDQHNRWMTFVLDISEQKRIQAEKEMAFQREQTAREHAEEATRLKDEFLANLSHELRTPMNIIIGWTHLLRTGALAPEQQMRAVDAIDRAARSQAQLIEDLLDVSRIITGKFRLQMKPVEVGPVVEAAVDSLKVGAQARQIKLNVELEAPDIRVSGDSDRLQQVVWNLVSNAVKFTPAGGHVEVRLARSDTHACIIVQDSGKGITREFLPFVFDRFRQADGTSTREHMGMGLGLAIVRHVIELHGGSVRAESEGEGKGSVFTVKLPIASPVVTTRELRQDRPARIASLPSPRTTSELRVLLVEDDPDAKEVAAAGLLRAGFELRTAASALEALDILDDWQPDVIVSDISMPEMDGYEFIRELRTRPPERGGRIPALALTAYARLEDAARALASGYQGHAAKPINPVELTEAIVKLMHGTVPTTRPADPSAR